MSVVVKQASSSTVNNTIFCATTTKVTVFVIISLHRVTQQIEMVLAASWLSKAVVRGERAAKFAWQFALECRHAGGKGVECSSMVSSGRFVASWSVHLWHLGLSLAACGLYSRAWLGSLEKLSIIICVSVTHFVRGFETSLCCFFVFVCFLSAFAFESQWQFANGIYRQHC